MGRRKAKKAAPKRKLLQPLDTIFDCPFCNHTKSCEVTMDKTDHKGHIECTVCSEYFSCKLNYLMEAIDVFNAWVDECEEANK